MACANLRRSSRLSKNAMKAAISKTIVAEVEISAATMRPTSNARAIPTPPSAGASTRHTIDVVGLLSIVFTALCLDPMERAKPVDEAFHAHVDRRRGHKSDVPAQILHIGVSRGH